MRVFEAICRFLAKLIGAVFVRTKVSGLENIPESGGYIIAPNHLNAIDPVFVEYKMKRRVHWMAKAELFDKKFVGWFFRKMGAFPVKRGVLDVNAAKTVFTLLEQGELVGIFPQGTRSKDPENPAKARHGVTKFAVEANVSIIPVALYGNFKLFGKAYVKFGKPIKLEKKADGTPYTKAEYTEMAQQLVDGIYAMTKEELPDGDN